MSRAARQGWPHPRRPVPGRVGSVPGGSGRPGTARRRHPPVASRVRGGGAGPIAVGSPARVPSAPLRKDAT